jgi:hypothetical protein
MQKLFLLKVASFCCFGNGPRKSLEKKVGFLLRKTSSRSSISRKENRKGKEEHHIKTIIRIWDKQCRWQRMKR